MQHTHQLLLHVLVLVFIQVLSLLHIITTNTPPTTTTARPPSDNGLETITQRTTGLAQSRTASRPSPTRRPREGASHAANSRTPRATKSQGEQCQAILRAPEVQVREGRQKCGCGFQGDEGRRGPRPVPGTSPRLPDRALLRANAPTLGYSQGPSETWATGGSGARPVRGLDRGLSVHGGSVAGSPHVAAARGRRASRMHLQSAGGVDPPFRPSRQRPGDPQHPQSQQQDEAEGPHPSPLRWPASSTRGGRRGSKGRTEAAGIFRARTRATRTPTFSPACKRGGRNPAEPWAGPSQFGATARGSARQQRCCNGNVPDGNASAARPASASTRSRSSLLTAWAHAA